MSNAFPISGSSPSPGTPESRRHQVGDADTTSPSTFGRPLQERTLQHVAMTVPPGVSLHNAPPSAILQRLLDDIKQPTSRHYARYGAFVSAEGEGLVQLLERCVRKEVWDLSARATPKSSHSRRVDVRRDVEALKAVGGDTGYFGRAVYLHVVEFSDGTTRLYVGQAFNLAARIKRQHDDFRYRRDHPSLHNFAVDRSAGDTYVVLAQLRENTRSDLVLNLLEMWMALWLGTLPDETLNDWLGPVDLRGESAGTKKRRENVFGLNVAVPLDQGDSEASTRAFQMLKDAKDDLAREYFWDIRKRPRPVVRAVTVEDHASWTLYVPHFLACTALGFVLGRWSSFLRRK
ncbi:uncharacterized protein PV09_05469 [Verruconis gallopava]|uniref:GIY-YIG domain-containing protein n=1 Tax=Verruconis gallopava TaxID=253628 RepID=A0A0D2A906_9PEZI|nr:uncharacterized protein PV09_05469 [Verruconis gallopava]KIW03248.1 hypothetical protein PV09_05469 [Verruconis gallopava]